MRHRKWHTTYCDELSKRFVSLMEEFRTKHDVTKEYFAWTLQTDAGVLRFHLFDDWIAGQFESPSIAKEFVDCNPYSGKWNFHTHATIYESQSEVVTLDDFFFHFRHCLNKVFEQEGSHAEV